MLSVATITAASAGGRSIASTPSLAYAYSGQFTISPYDSSYTYTHTGATRSGATLSVTSATSGTVSLTARTPKAVAESTAATCERKAYSYTADNRYTVHENVGESGPGPTCTMGGGYYPHWDTNAAGQSVNAHCGRDSTYGSAPVLIDQSGSGYTNSGSEWYKST